MKRTLKRSLSLLLAAVMLFGASPIGALAEIDFPSLHNLFTIEAEATAYSGTCGDTLTWSFDDSTGELVISGTGDMTNWSSYSYVPWYSYRSSIKSVTIGNSVTSIGYSAFYNCESLTSVTIGSGVTSVDYHAFNKCDNLTDVYYTGDLAGWCSISWKDSYGRPMFYPKNLYIDGTLLSGDIVIPDTVTSIGDFAFFNCQRITSVTIPDSVKSIGNYAFYDCYNLTSLTIGNSVIDIGFNAFSNCSFTSLTLGDSVKRIGDDAFSGCFNLASVTVGKSVKKIGYNAFKDCSSLVSITVDKDNAYYSSDEYGALFNKTKTWLIKYPGANKKTTYTVPDTVTNIEDFAFDYCRNLTSITIPDSVTSIGNYAFEDCSSLTSVTIPDSVTSIGDYAFYYCKSLTSVTIGNGVKSIGNYAFYNTAYYKNTSNWENDVLYIGKYLIEAEDTISGEYTIKNGTLAIADFAFCFRTGLTSVTIPDSVTSIGEYAFYRCTGLTSVTIGNSVTSIGEYAFDDTAYFEDTSNWENDVLYIGKYLIEAEYTISGEYAVKNGTLTIADAAFYDCSGLASIEIPDSVISIGEKAFNVCINLKKIVVDEDNRYYSSDSYGVLFNKDKTVLLQYPNGNERSSYTIPDSVKRIEKYAFKKCDNLVNVIFNEDSSLKIICEEAFCNCISLKALKLPGSAERIEALAFALCYSLSELDLANVKFLGHCSFSDCDELKEVFIPNTLTDAESAYHSMIAFKIVSHDPITAQGGEYFDSFSCSPFFNSVNLHTIEFESGMETVPSYVFAYTKVKKATFPASVKVVEEHAFSQCELDEVYFSGTKEAWDKVTIEYDNGNLSNLTVKIIVPEDHSHSYTSSITTPATCKNTGIRTYTCECGDTYTEIIPKTDHTLTHTKVESTCKEKGYECDTCTVCGGTFNSVELPLADHSLKHITVASTCTQRGYECDECTVCGETFNRVNLPIGNHTYTYVKVESTCTEKGYECDKCTVCGGTFNKVELPLADHKLAHTKVESTCKEKGYECDKCTVCGGIFNSVELPLADHKLTHTKVESTCKEKGYEYDKCTVCGTEFTRTELPLADHSLKHITVASTCKVPGMEYDLCTVCGTTFNPSVLPLADHTWGEWTVIAEPTADAEGLAERICSVCGLKSTKVLPKLTVVKDESTGIEIIYSDEYDELIELKIEELFDGSSFQILESNFGDVTSVIYDITTIIDGEKVQPNGTVKVRIPVPDSFSNGAIFVCFVNSEDGTIESIPAVIKDGYVEFETTHFSHYAVVEKFYKLDSITINDIEVIYKNSAKIQPKIVADDELKYTVSFSSSNASVATVDAKGSITTTGRGTATITCTVTDEYGNSVSDTCTVTVKYAWWQWIIIILLFGWIWY